MPLAPPAARGAARGLLLAVLFAATSAGGLARADEPEARVHFDEGLKAFDAGEYQAAAAEFETAYRLKPHPDFLLNIATTYERMYRAGDARRAYERFLAEAPPRSELRALADKRLRILRSLPGSILVDAGLKGAEVLLTDKASGLEHRQIIDPGAAASSCTFADLPPGSYHVHVSAPGYVPIDEDVALEPNESHAITQHLVREMEVVTVFSVPDGAHLFVDNRDTGERTPVFRSYEVGKHSLRLELPDRPPYQETFQLEAGKPVFRRAVLPPPPRSGRTEMMIAAMIFGGYAATSLTVAIGGTRVTTGDGLAILVPTAVAGVGLGLLGSWAFTDEAMKVGHSSIIVGSTLWGGLAGASLAFGLGLTGDTAQRITQQNTLALSLLGGGLGMGAGILTAWLDDTSPGDAAIVNSGALWGIAATSLLTESLAFNRDHHDRALGWLTLGGNVLGVTSGALLAHAFEVSRAHVAVIDAAALAGALIGYGIGFAAGNDSDDTDSGSVCRGAPGRCISAARYSLGGLALGLVTAAILTRKFKFDMPRTEALLQRHDGRWQLGLPGVRLGSAPIALGQGAMKMDQRGIVELAKGEW